MDGRGRCSVSSERTFLASRQGYIAENFLFVGLAKAGLRHSLTVPAYFPAHLKTVRECQFAELAATGQSTRSE